MLEGLVNLRDGGMLPGPEDLEDLELKISEAMDAGRFHGS